MKKIIVLCGLVSVLMLSSVALAQTTENVQLQEADRLEVRKLELQKERQGNIDQRCESIKQKMATRVARYENNKGRRVSAYNNLQSRLTRFAERFKTAGLNTTKLESDLKELDVKIKKLSQDYATFVGKMNEAQSAACGTPVADLKTKLDGSKAIMQTLKKDALDIRNFFQTVIRPDIMTLRQELQNKTVTTETEKQKTDNAENTAPVAVELEDDQAGQ